VGRQILEAFFARHKRIAFQFSAGKDSAAVLWLLEEYWAQMDIVWGNPGNPYPETLAYMEDIAKRVPRFFCVLGDQSNSIQRNGWPVDIVPMEATQIGMTLKGQSAIRLRPFWECCWENLWGPMQEFIKHGDYTAVIRGQKCIDRLKGPAASGTITDGIEYFHPIEDWTDEQVFTFLGESRLPASYKRGLRSSLDCKNCTAYTLENPGRLADLATLDPQAWQEVTTVHLRLLDSLAAHTEAIRSCHAHPTL